MKTRYFKALFMILLILIIPIYIPEFSAAQAPPQKLPDPAEACMDKAEKSSSLVDFVDNEMISTITGVLQILYFFCTIVSVIDGLLNNFYVLICENPLFNVPATGSAVIPVKFEPSP